MKRTSLIRTAVPLLMAGLLRHPAVAAGRLPLATVRPDRAVARYAIPPAREPHLSHLRLLGLLRKRVRYVFVLYQENRSFDFYFGTFPGAEGLYSHPAAKTPGFYQAFPGPNGQPITVHPFRLGPEQYAADIDDLDHSHPGLVSKMDVVNGRARMDAYARSEASKYSRGGRSTALSQQCATLVMAHVDGDTVPFLWRYANRFVLFDHIFQQMTGPSTPGNLAIIGAQTGATQWMRHPDEAVPSGGGAGVPVLNDLNPFWGSALDPTTGRRQPYNPGDLRKKAAQRNLTYATLPLTLAGRRLSRLAAADRSPADLADVAEDVAAITRSGKAPVPWGWYQEGYDREPTDPPTADPTDAAGLHASYITHHNGPQYFGYIADNPKMSASLHGLADFYRALDRRTLPSSGVFYVKGGRQNLLGLKPADPDPRAQARFRGDDDHPGYSDSQISEAEVAETINRIAKSPYWSHCAIVVAWDDSDGLYDHLPPTVRSRAPDGSVLTDGPRVPLLVISPYARTHAVIHDPGDHASVVKLVDAVFSRTPLADLPDEREGRRLGERRGLKNEGPFDDRTAGITDLLAAFDPARLAGRAAPLPGAYATIPEALVRTLPQQSHFGWRQVGVMPVDVRLGIRNGIPRDFNPRPKAEPDK